MKLSFMTFVCPEWDIETIVKFAKGTDYDGVEIRVDVEHKHNVSSKSSAEKRRYVKEIFAIEDIDISCIATSVQLAYPEPNKHRENLDAAKANLDLAADLEVPILRVFAGGGIPVLNVEAAEQISDALDEIGNYSKGSCVCPVLECGHDVIKGASEASEVIKRVKTENFGTLWNHSEMDDQTFEVLKDKIKHLHVHDDVLDPYNTNVLSLAKRMKSIDYQGYVSLEIIRGENLPEELIKETATRLKRYIAET